MPKIWYFCVLKECIWSNHLKRCQLCGLRNFYSQVSWWFMSTKFPKLYPICTRLRSWLKTWRKMLHKSLWLTFWDPATLIPVLLVALHSDLSFCCPVATRLYSASISLSCGLENAPREKSWVYVMFILFASFSLKDHSAALAAVQCLQTVVIYVLSRFYTCL